jgi:hypothetical protein
MPFKIEGRIKVVQEPRKFSSGFVKREFVVTVDDGKYPQDISLEVMQDKVALLDDLRIGDEVSVAFDIRGREYNGRHFNNLVAWNIRKEGAAPPVSERTPPEEMGDGEIPF